LVVGFRRKRDGGMEGHEQMGCADKRVGGKGFTALDLRSLPSMKNPFSWGGSPARQRHQDSGLESIPEGAQVLPMDVKKLYEPNPVHIYHPTPYNAITTLRNKKETHDWLVCGWYLDTYREHGVVKGLVYRAVTSREDREHVTIELKKLDKDASIKFDLS
jgi:hypothetical protein